MPIATWSPVENASRRTWFGSRQAGERAGGRRERDERNGKLDAPDRDRAHALYRDEPGDELGAGLLGACKMTPSLQACRVMPSNSGPSTSGAGSV